MSCVFISANRGRQLKNQAVNAVNDSAVTSFYFICLWKSRKATYLLVFIKQIPKVGGRAHYRFMHLVVLSMAVQWLIVVNCHKN